MSSLLDRSGWLVLFISFWLISTTVRAQLTGVKTIPGDYASVTLAVSALNSSGVGSGGVTFNIAANYTETITSTLSITATGTAVNPILFQKDPSTSGANPLITSYTGGIGTPATAVQDGIWRLVGSDYVTIRNIDVRDNPLNVTNPSTMEYGFALYKVSTTNGCQNVRIEGCTITLNRLNNASATNPMTEGSAGIIVMNATATNAIVVLAAGVGGSNSNNKFYGNTIQNCNIGISMIGVSSASPYTNSDTNNDVGGSAALTGNTIINYGGGLAASNTATAIRTLNQYGLNVSYNVINNNNGTGVNHPVALYGILVGAAAGANATITNNSITLKGGGTTTNITAIENASGTTAANNTINISNNSIVDGTYTTATTGNFFGIVNTASPATLTVANNTLTGNSTAATSGIYGPIRNTGAVTTAINITGNQVGNGSSGAVTYTAANSGSQVFISNTAGATTAALTIANNNFQGINYSVSGTGLNTYILNSAATLSQAITGNTFSSLNVGTSGNVTFISNNVALSATGTQNINNNSIVTSFTKSVAGGTVTLYTSSTASAAGGVSNNIGNNFSNITITGATVMDGWVNTDSGSGTKTIQNNTFSNWSVGTSACNGMNVNLTSTSNSITGNTISNIVGGGSVTGITTAAGNDKISGNTIRTLSTTGTAVVIGILVTGGTNKHVFGNKIYDLQLSNTGNLVTGISVTGTTVATANIYNNLIGDLKAPIASSTSDVIRGISVSTTSVNSTINVYYNTIHINASSSGTNFSTSGVFHTGSATGTTALLNLRNNIISNTSTPNGTGVTVALRRSITALNNYATTSNNNLFHAGSPTSNKLIYYDGTNFVQTLTAFKTHVSPMESSSVTEDLVSSSKFVSVLGSSAFFLHLDPAKPTLAESGAVNVTGFNVDFDGQTRQGNPGYSGTGSSPDIGADEIAGIRAGAMTGTYSVGIGQPFTSLTGAGGLFAEINSTGLSSNIIVNVTSDLSEDGSYALLPWVEQGAGNYTITIKPVSSVMRTISGNVTTGMIRLNGAKRVIIDGSNGTTTNYLTFRNTNTAGTTGTAFTFINGASNNTISYCNLEAFANATNGVVLFSTSNAATGNNNNTLNNCSINATVGANTGNVGIYSLGTTGKENTSNSILNNNIFNYRDRGFDIPATGSTAWTITGNSVFNGTVSGSVSYAAGSFVYGIKVSGGSGYTISNNFIGGSAALATGSNAQYTSTLGLITYNGIHVTTTSATPVSSIKGNTIAGVNVSCVPTSITGSNVLMGIETFGSGINIGGPLAGEGNLIGSTTNNASIVVTTTTSVTNAISNVHTINCSSSGGQVIGNRSGGIDIQNLGTALSATTFRGIYVNGATAPTSVSGNTMGGSIASSIRFLSASAPGSLMSGITVGTLVTSPVTITGNTIQNMSFQSTAGTGSNVYGIANNAGANSVVTLTNNIITGNSTAATTGGMVGIYSASTSTSVTISGNTISSNTVTSPGSSLFGISPGGSGTPVISITGNTISNNTTASNLMSIYNLANATTVNINSNTFTGNTITSAAATFYAVYNQGTASSTININGNIIGNSTTPAVTYSVANSGFQQMILNTGGSAATNLTISNNIIQGINHSLQASSGFTLINNTALTTLSQTISGNVFTNLSINTTGNVTLIGNNVVVSATGTQNINNNSISGTFAKTGAGGAVVGFSNASAASVSGAVINHNNNNFSNMTVSGATTLTGWLITDPGSSTRTISNNTFNNWTAATGTVTAMAMQLTGTANTITANTISNITSTGTLNGITSAANENIFLNTIHSLASNGDVTIIGINVTAGTTKNIYKNKIYNLNKTIVGTSNFAVSGIAVTAVSASSTTNIYNNLIGDLKAPAASGTDAIRGIGVTSSTTSSTINVYYNTAYLNASSTGTNFGTSALFHTANATASIGLLDSRNNILVNLSTPAGTGRTVAFRRSATTVNNLSTSSNNNLFYAGTTGATRLIYFDGTNADQTLGGYQLRTLRELGSRTENITPALLSTTGSSSLFLHISSVVSTQIESGGSNITGYTTDFDGQIRAGNTGYTGSSFFPDIGADEIFGAESVLPVITYTLLPNTSSTANVVLSNVTITDASGINTVAGTKPRIYYKRSSDANQWLDNTPATSGWKYTEATNATSPFSFTIDYSLLYGGATSIAGAIQYFVVAQDNSTIPNVAINSGTFASTPASVALTSTAFPLAGTINSYLVSFAGTYNVGVNEAFTSLTRVDGLFAAINSAGLNASVTVNITSDLSEDGLTALNQWTETGAGGYTLAIRPDAGIPRTISGNAINGLIRFNGADRVTVDGRNGGVGPFLRFVNTNTLGSSGTAFTFLNGATFNTIQYSEIAAYADATRGVILLSTSIAATGNTNNTIDNCSISATVAGNTGNVAICSIASASLDNSSIVISNNIISGYRDRGIDVVSPGSLWTISGNSLYNGDISSSINFTGSVLHGMRIQGGAGQTIINNYIGGSEPLAAGNAVYASATGNVSFTGILLTTSAATPASVVRGNTISGVTISSAPTAATSRSFVGIETGGQGITVGGSGVGEGNTIGSASVNGALSITTNTTSAANTSLFWGINFQSIGGSIVGNKVSGIDVTNIGSAPAPSTIIGIRVAASTAPTPVSNNTIGGSVSNSIRIQPSTTALATVINGIVSTSAVTGPVTYDANIIQNISNLSSTSSGSFIGINNTAASSAAATITNNLIQGISASSNVSTSSGVYAGIYSQSTSTINNNTIDNISSAAAGNTAQVRGIWTGGTIQHSITSNIISNLSSAATRTSDIESASPTEYVVAGILSGATNGPQTISGNTLFGLNATSSSTINTTISAIAVTAVSTGTISGNRINTLVNNATGTATLPGITGIVANNGTFNVYNNAISLRNSSNTNRVKVYGILHATSTSWNYYYNTVLIAGSASGAARSAAFVRTTSGTVVLRNNILLNTRTGSGPHFSISNSFSTPSTNWTTSTSDYNDLFSNGTIAEWGSTPSTFAQWKTLSGGDSHSVSQAVTFISSTNDLAPDPLANCSINNAAIPITSPITITTDIVNTTRNATTPDIGAYEFTYSTIVAIASNNSPVCNASPVSLAVDPGTAISPTFLWTDPGSNVISTLQNPSVSATAGTYTVTVTDATGCSVNANTIVTTLARPTANITGTTTICNGSTATISLTGTGSGTLNGTFSSGDGFNGAPPSFTIGVVPTTTTVYTITSLSDNNCTALPQDLSGTVTITVNATGSWNGTSSVNWNDPLNWCGGVPLPTTNVRITPGTPFSPQISGAGSVSLDLLIDASAVLTMNGTATLDIKGDFTNNGTLVPGDGTLIFSGSTIQNITSSTTPVLNNLIVTNVSSPGLRVQSNHQLRGILTLGSNASIDADGSANTSVFTLLSSADNPTQDASIASLPSGASVVGNITIQRFMSIEGPDNGRIYRYISSPLQNATVADIQNEIPITGTFTGASACAGCQQNNSSLYSYNETIINDQNNSGIADRNDGYIQFPVSSNSESLLPGRGYALFVRAPLLSTARWDVRGTINAANITPISLPVSFTSSGSATNDGWNLVGNPLPSSIDWNSSSGWTKTNIDATIYTTDNGNGPTQYSTWNGVTGTNGGSRYIAMAQAFWVKASASAPSLQVNESVKTAGTQTTFFRTSAPHDMLRITMRNATNRDEAVVHFRSDATNAFDNHADAIKLDNANFNVWTTDDAGNALAINSIAPFDCSTTLKLNVWSTTAGSYRLDFSGIDTFDDHASIILIDQLTSQQVDMRSADHYDFTFSPGATITNDRFRILISFPPAQISASGNTLSSNYNQGNQWYLNGVIIPGATQSTLEPKVNGRYHVEVTAGKCMILSDKRDHIITGIAEDHTSEITVSPNPARDRITISIPGDFGNVVQVKISNVVGQVVGEIKLRPDGDNKTGEFVMTNLPPGLYLVHITGEKSVSSIRMIKE